MLFYAAKLNIIRLSRVFPCLCFAKATKKDAPLISMRLGFSFFGLLHFVFLGNGNFFAFVINEFVFEEGKTLIGTRVRFVFQFPFEFRGEKT